MFNALCFLMCLVCLLVVCIFAFVNKQLQLWVTYIKFCLCHREYNKANNTTAITRQRKKNEVEDSLMNGQRERLRDRHSNATFLEGAFLASFLCPQTFICIFIMFLQYKIHTISMKTNHFKSRAQLLNINQKSRLNSNSSENAIFC